MKFSALNVDFSSPSPDFLSLRRPASKRDTSVKIGYFTGIGSSNVKTVADGHRHAAYYNENW